jgi:hypothetical protein
VRDATPGVPFDAFFGAVGVLHDFAFLPNYTLEDFHPLQTSG